MASTTRSGPPFPNPINESPWKNGSPHRPTEVSEESGVGSQRPCGKDEGKPSRRKIGPAIDNRTGKSGQPARAGAEPELDIQHTTRGAPQSLRAHFETKPEPRARANWAPTPRGATLVGSLSFARLWFIAPNTKGEVYECQWLWFWKNKLLWISLNKKIPSKQKENK
jgi:hypothetical protein